jgi:hypothetical protein
VKSIGRFGRQPDDFHVSGCRLFCLRVEAKLGCDWYRSKNVTIIRDKSFRV